MGLPFVKMHGCGNDYIYVDCFRHDVPDPEKLAVKVSDRHTGVGGDGLVLVLPSNTGHARMRMFNADGSEAEMCGNAIRCVAKLVYEAGHAPHDSLAIEVGRQQRRRLLQLNILRTGETVTGARVAMGVPSFVRQDVPMSGEPGVRVLDEQLAIPGTRTVLTITCLTLGNPHCVTFSDAPPTLTLLEELGPSVERHRVFPNRINASFAHVKSPKEIVLRVWERGSGPTLACGTGAAATVAAAIVTQRIPGPRATVQLPGGDLEIEWDPSRDEQVYMTGPATEVFRGELSTA